MSLEDKIDQVSRDVAELCRTVDKALQNPQPIPPPEADRFAHWHGLVAALQNERDQFNQDLAATRDQRDSLRKREEFFKECLRRLQPLVAGYVYTKIINEARDMFAGDQGVARAALSADLEREHALLRAELNTTKHELEQAEGRIKTLTAENQWLNNEATQFFRGGPFQRAVAAKLFTSKIRTETEAARIEDLLSKNTNHKDEDIALVGSGPIKPMGKESMGPISREPTDQESAAFMGRKMVVVDSRTTRPTRFIYWPARRTVTVVREFPRWAYVDPVVEHISSLPEAQIGYWPQHRKG